MSVPAPLDDPLLEESLSLLAFTDVHGRALEWDYLSDAPPVEPGSLARIATLVRQIRAESAASLLFDVGDTIQGTSMTALAAREKQGRHPMAVALNHLGVDAACLGNHEFNYGLQQLGEYVDDCAFPVLAANFAGVPGIARTTMLNVSVGALGEVRVGVLGLSTPGSLIWDRHLLHGRVRADGVVQGAGAQVRALRDAGADVVVVLSHSGLGPSTTYGDALVWPENDTRRLIQDIPGIDAVFLGHKHVEVAGHEQCRVSGASVPYVEPLCYGQRLGRIDLRLRRTPAGAIEVIDSAAHSLPVAQADVDPALADLLADVHERTRAYVDSPVGVATEQIPARPVTDGPSPALDLINTVQASAVGAALGEADGRRVLSVTASLDDYPGLPAGALSIRDLSRLYRFENLLQAVEMSTAELIAYLEHNALGFGAASDVPWYNVDSLGSAEHDVSYVVDPAAKPGARISGLRIDGAPPAPDEKFVVAISSYRASGGGGFPATSANPLVYDDQLDVRDLLIDWIRARARVGPADFRRASWRVRSTNASTDGESNV